MGPQLTPRVPTVMKFVERSRNILYFSPGISRVRKNCCDCPHVLYELCFFLCIDNSILCLYLREGCATIVYPCAHTGKPQDGNMSPRVCFFFSFFLLSLWAPEKDLVGRE